MAEAPTPSPAPASAAPAAPAVPNTIISAAPAPAAPASGEPATPAAPAAPAPPGAWTDDWVARMARGDDKRQARLSRYASPEAVADALIAAQNRIASGEMKSVLPKDAKPEEIAAWRKENGIPETPDKYDLNFQNGIVIGEKDKPIVDGFLKRAHESNMPPDQVKNTVQWYYEEQVRQSEARAAKDQSEKSEALDALNAEYGQSFRRNVNLVEGVLSQFPESVREKLKGARLPDGRGVFNDPDVFRGFVALALQANPAGTVVPAGGGDPAKGTLDEYQAIQKVRAENRAAYSKDDKMQVRERELIDAMIKMGLMDELGNLKDKKAA